MSKKEVTEVKINYRKNISSSEDNGFSEYLYDYIKVSTKFTKRYRNAVCILMGISECPHKLLDWMQDNMTPGGYITNNKLTRKSFIEFHFQYSGDEKPYSDHSVQKAFGQLVDVGLIISVEKGTYQLNPMFFWNDRTDSEREKSIKLMMEFVDGIETKISLEVKR